MNFQGIIDWIAQLAEAHWQDLLPILVGTLAALGLTAIVEKFVPVTWPTRVQQGATSLLNIGISWPLCTVLWGTLDPLDSRTMRSVWSLSSSVIALYFYPMFARWATKRWPAIASVYAAGQ